MSTRLIHVGALIVALLAATTTYGVTIRHTVPHYLTEADNTRLCEFFGSHKASIPTRTAVYSDTTCREGLFFTAALDTKLKNLPAGTSAQLEVFFQDDRAARVFKFDLAAVATSHHKNLYLGLTGPEYRDKGSLPHLLAWKVTLLDDKAAVLSENHSKLWQY